MEGQEEGQPAWPPHPAEGENLKAKKSVPHSKKVQTDRPFAVEPQKVEILMALPAGHFSPELRSAFKSEFLPVLKALVPNGAGISLAFVEDPPTLEIRRPLA